MDTKCDCLPRFVQVENSSRKDEGFSEAIAWKTFQKFFGLEIFFSGLIGSVERDSGHLGGLSAQLAFKLGNATYDWAVFFGGRSVVDGKLSTACVAALSRPSETMQSCRKALFLYSIQKFHLLFIKFFFT